MRQKNVAEPPYDVEMFSGRGSMNSGMSAAASVTDL